MCKRKIDLRSRWKGHLLYKLTNCTMKPLHPTWCLNVSFALDMLPWRWLYCIHYIHAFQWIHFLQISFNSPSLEFLVKANADFVLSAAMCQTQYSIGPLAMRTALIESEQYKHQRASQRELHNICSENYTFFKPVSSWVCKQGFRFFCLVKRKPASWFNYEQPQRIWTCTCVCKCPCNCVCMHVYFTGIAKCTPIKFDVLALN